MIYYSTNFMESITKIEENLENLVKRGQEELSGNRFHLYSGNLLDKHLNFRHIDAEIFVAYQFGSDLGEHKPFKRTSKRGHVKEVPKGIAELEELTKQINKYLKRKKLPKFENYARRVEYTRKEGEKITVLTHHDSPITLLDGTLISPNLNISTTIVYESPYKDVKKKERKKVTKILGLKKATRTFLGESLGEVFTEGKDNIVLKTLEQDAALKYKNKYIIPYSFLIDAARLKVKEANIQPRQLSTFA